jgi:hypothetical protein
MTDFYALRRYRSPGRSVIEQVEEDAMYEPTRTEIWTNFGLTMLSIGMACLVVWFAIWLGSHMFHALAVFGHRLEELL